MADKLLFYYLGDDEAYFRSLQSEFKKHVKTPIVFQRFYESTESKIQALFLKIYTNKPQCVFIDFSKQTQDYLHLSRLLSRTPLDHQLLTVGLVDLLSPSEVLKEGIATGANLAFIKSAEIFDVIYSTMKICAPEGIGEHGFATSELSDEMETSYICKIGFVTETGIHIETDQVMNKGDRLVFNHYWLKKKVVPSRYLIVTEATGENLFYQYKMSADLDFVFVDDYIPPPDMNENDKQERLKERDHKIVQHKKLLKKWIDDNMISSLEKKAKILVIDSEFRIYQDHKRTDKYPYTIRCVSTLTDAKQDLERAKPQVIAFQLDEGENGKNNLEVLKKLSLSLMSGQANSGVYIIVFGCTLSSEELQSALQYKSALAHNENLSADLLIKISDLLQKKMTQNEAKLKPQTPPQKKFFINKTNRASIGEIVKTIKLLKLSETDLILQSEMPLPAGTNLIFTKPVEMIVNVFPNPKPTGKLPESIGLIHGITETNKKELRRFINSVFFRDHDAQKQAESDEYTKLNEQKLHERLSAEAKAKEDAEKKDNPGSNEDSTKTSPQGGE